MFPHLAEHTQLSQDELLVFYEIQNKFIMPYDPKNAQHEAMLKRLYLALTGESEVPSEIESNQLRSPIWKDFGFQSENPRTDFRAAGFLGLRQLVYLAEKYP